MRHLKGPRTGYQVHLVEKGKHLGGYAGRMYKLLPSAGRDQALSEPDVKALADRVEAHPRIEVHLESTIGSYPGRTGKF